MAARFVSCPGETSNVLATKGFRSAPQPGMYVGRGSSSTLGGMKVFISHSGERSRALADKMKWFVGNLVQATEPWISTGIDKGARWIPELATQLEASGVGIVCLTADNLESRWILFEAGALAKKLDGRVCTLLLDVKPEQVLPPLDQFQHTMPEQEDVWKLVTTVTKALQESGGKPPIDVDLRKSFDDYYWPQLEKAILAIREQAPATGPPERSEREMITELLDLARQGVRAAVVQERTLALVHQIHDGITHLRPRNAWRLSRDAIIKLRAAGVPESVEGSHAASDTTPESSPANLRTEDELK
jgi:hypothetical protein